MHLIDSITTIPVDLPLKEVFATSQRKANSSPSVFIKVSASGITGWGEATPLKYVTQEDRESVIFAVNQARKALIGKPVESYRICASRLFEAIPNAPCARAGVEIAIMDAAAKAAGLPLYLYLGGRSITVETDITIPLIEPKIAATLAFTAYKRGFSRFKVKVGGADREADFDRVVAIAAAVKGSIIILDANEAFEPDEALSLVNRLIERDITIDVLEQPVPRNDISGLAQVTRECPVPVHADEAAKSPQDVLKLAQHNAATGIVIKIMKSGLIGALEMIDIAKAAQLDLMMGTMLESRIGQSASLHLAAATGAFTRYDLDSDTLLAEQSVSGGFTRTDSILTLSHEPGLGVQVLM